MNPESGLDAYPLFEEMDGLTCTLVAIAVLLLFAGFRAFQKLK